MDGHYCPRKFCAAALIAFLVTFRTVEPLNPDIEILNSLKPDADMRRCMVDAERFFSAF